MVDQHLTHKSLLGRINALIGFDVSHVQALPAEGALNEWSGGRFMHETKLGA